MTSCFSTHLLVDCSSRTGSCPGQLFIEASSLPLLTRFCSLRGQRLLLNRRTLEYENYIWHQWQHLNLSLHFANQYSFTLSTISRNACSLGSKLEVTVCFESKLGNQIPHKVQAWDERMFEFSYRTSFLIFFLFWSKTLPWCIKTDIYTIIAYFY